MEFQPMSPEEMQQTLQFLLVQQAQFATNLEKLTGQTDRIADAIVGLTGIVGHIAERQERTDQQIRETNTRMEQLGNRVDQLGGYIKSVESHLNVVIDMFERHLREDHGHRPS